MSEPPSLAPLRTARLKVSGLKALFCDIEASCSLPRCRVRTRRGANAAAAPSLRAALDGLIAGQWEGIQVAYEFQGETWLDTLLDQGEGEYTLVRTRVPAPPLAVTHPGSKGM